MDIDLATGLPELPEGMFWDVQRSVRTFDREDMSITVYLYKTETVENKVTKIRTFRSWKTLWFKAEQTYAENETHQRTQQVLSNIMADQIWVKGEEFLKYLDDGWVVRRVECDNSKVVMSLMERLWEPTAESVLKAATEIMETYTVEQEEKIKEAAYLKKQNDLIGKYPPKVLKRVTPASS